MKKKKSPFFLKYQFIDSTTEKVFFLSGIVVILILLGIVVTLFFGSIPSIKTFGLKFLVSSDWNPVKEQYGAFPFIGGTLITAFLALLFSLPFSLSISVLLGSTLKKGKLTDALQTIIDLLAGIPSVIYGFWGIFFLTPIIKDIEILFGAKEQTGFGILTASIILTIMIIPYSASLGTSIIRMVPKDLVEAGYALGSTNYEVTKNIILPYSLSGIYAGNILALGRALGETMAVTMLIGNRSIFPTSIFSTGNSIASIIANTFNEADGIQFSVLIELGLILIILSGIINFLGKFIIKKFSNRGNTSNE